METVAPLAPATTVCVTGAAGYVGSWLVMKLLERGYIVHATVRDPEAKTNLTLWKADMTVNGSFDEAIQGCQGVFHVATPMDFESKDPLVRFSSKKLIEKGFTFKYTFEDMYRGAIETCREKGLLPHSTQIMLGLVRSGQVRKTQASEIPTKHRTRTSHPSGWVRDDEY